MKKLSFLVLLILTILFFEACQQQRPVLPKADFSTECQKVIANEVTQFKNLSQKAIAYRWDFGDGVISEDFEPQHVYRRSGEYVVTLTAKSPDHSTVIVQAITVLP